MSIIEQKSIDELKLKADIVGIIEHYIEVKKQGSGFVAVCPFHDDRNPSLHINERRGFYHCFACKAGGDVFKFVQDYERIGFGEAVERVASLTGFTLSYTNKAQESNKELLAVLPLLNAFYKQNLSKNQNALKYLYERALSDEDIRKFELGFAPNSDETLRLLQNEKIELKNAAEAGAVKFSHEQKSYYASFIRRISFPIYDYKGVLVGFGGRTIDPAQPAKYVNSPQCRLFDKSRVFYGINLAKEAIAKKGEMIVCEGYMDAIAFHKAGLNNAVAVLGTALTEHHLPQIRRLEARVILCFDSDKAGLNAAMRSAFLLSTQKIDGKVVHLEGGKDAAELVANGDGAALFKALDKGVELGEFYIRQIIAQNPLKSPLDKQKALEAVQKYAFLLEPLVAQNYEKLVAQLLGADEKLIKLTKNAQNSRKKSAANSVNSASLKKDLAEISLLNFLYENASFRDEFYALCDESCFKDRDLLRKILQGVSIEDSAVREMLEYSQNNAIKNPQSYLHAICKMNLSALNRAKNASLTQSLKKQIYALLDRYATKKLPNLKDDESVEFRDFFTQILKDLRQSEDEDFLMSVLQNFQRNEFDLNTILSENDELF